MERVADAVEIEMVVFQIMDLGRAWLFAQLLGIQTTHRRTLPLAGIRKMTPMKIHSPINRLNITILKFQIIRATGYPISLLATKSRVLPPSNHAPTTPLGRSSTADETSSVLSIDWGSCLLRCRRAFSFAVKFINVVSPIFVCAVNSVSLIPLRSFAYCRMAVVDSFNAESPWS